MKIQKRLAGQILNASPKRIKFDQERLADIKEAITKTDIRRLISEGAITENQARGVSRGRARHIATQKSKGQRQGPGSRQGSSGARLPSKEAWMNKVRKQRAFLFTLKNKKIVDIPMFRDLYMKVKGGFFRSERHIKIYLEEKKILTDKKDTSQKPQPKVLTPKTLKKPKKDYKAQEKTQPTEDQE